MNSQLQLIAIYSTIIFCIYIVFLLMIDPLKYIFKIGIRLTLGASSLFLLNIIFKTLQFNCDIGINFITSFCTGYLGVFGIVAMIFIKSLV